MLERAKALPPGRRRIERTPEDIELALGWLFNEVGLTPVAITLAETKNWIGGKHTSRALDWLAATLKAAAEEGLLVKYP